MLLDTSVIIELLTLEPGSSSSELILGAIADQPIYCSIIQLGELSDWCLKNDLDPAEIVSRVEELVTIIPLTQELVLRGSRIKLQRRGEGLEKFGLIDGIIAASARAFDQQLITFDMDFRNEERVIVLTRTGGTE